MKISRVAWAILGGVGLASAGLYAAACSDDGGGTGIPTGTVDSSTDRTTGNTDTGTGSDTGTGGDTGSGDAGPDCQSAPQLRPGDGGSIFCPFATDSGGPITCSAGSQHCCQPPQGGGASTCQPIDAGCPVPAASDSGADWGCDEPASCGQGQVCCASIDRTPGFTQGCPQNYFASQNNLWATACKASCNATDAAADRELQICSKQADCPQGTTCTAFRIRGKQLGFCKPN